MKKIICSIAALLLCCFVFAACNNNKENSVTDYISESGRCVVSLPDGFDIVYENNDEERNRLFNEELYNADTINGKPKKEGLNYFSVLCDAPFRILTPLGTIQDKNSNNQTLVYWKLNDSLYKDSDSHYSENAFACVEDTEITPLYYEFRKVGMILLEADENDAPILSDGEIFDDNGDIIEQSGIYYLFGVYDFEPQRKFWKTNLTLEEFNLSYTVKSVAINFSKRLYTIDVKIKKSAIFDNGNLIAYSLCKIEGHGYILDKGSTNFVKAENATNVTLNCPIGEHQIKYTFID